MPQQCVPQPGDSGDLWSLIVGDGVGGKRAGFADQDQKQGVCGGLDSFSPEIIWKCDDGQTVILSGMKECLHQVFYLRGFF